MTLNKSIKPLMPRELGMLKKIKVHKIISQPKKSLPTFNIIEDEAERYSFELKRGSTQF